MPPFNATYVSIKGNDYRIHFWYISKNDAINIMKNSNLKKISEKTYYERNRDVILKKAKNYYENNKELLREKAKNNIENYLKKKKNIRREYGRNRYHNMSEE